MVVRFSRRMRTLVTQLADLSRSVNEIPRAFSQFVLSVSHAGIASGRVRPCSDGGAKIAR
jgi:hypothetical protein